MSKDHFNNALQRSDYGPPHGFASIGDYYGANSPHFYDRYESVQMRPGQRVLRKKGRTAEEI